MIAHGVRLWIAAFVMAVAASGDIDAVAAGREAPASFATLVAETKTEMLTDPRKAIVSADEARRFAQQQHSTIMLAEAEWLMGEAYSRVNMSDRAAPLLASARKRVEAVAVGSPLHAEILLSEGSVLTALGDVATALDLLQRAHQIFQSDGDRRSQAKALILIAQVYAGSNDYRNALRYYDQAKQAYRDEPGMTVAIENGRGVALLELDQRGAALRGFLDAERIARTMKSDLLIANIQGNIARTYLANEAPTRADPAIAEGLRLTSDAPDGGLHRFFMALAARSAFQAGRLDRAVALIDARFAGQDLAATTPVEWDAHDTAYRIYRRAGQPAKALAHLAAIKRLDDQATEIARSNSAALAGARFDFANQELRIAQLKATDLKRSVAFERARTRTLRWVLAGGAVAGLLIVASLAFGLFTMRRGRDKVRAANADLARTNVALGRALAAKTEFLATTSHEIRTPLNGILGMTQVMLSDAGIVGDTRDRLSVVRDAGTTMRALVDDILDVAKMESGTVAITPEAIDLHVTLSDATRLWREQAQAKGLRFDLDLAHAPGRILADPARLRQIVFNLLSNAVKFTAQGHVTIRAIDDGARFRVIVEDSGIGIAPAHHETIFESFQQADTSTTREFGGTGLGLTICRRLARAMGGDVHVTSATGAGAVFTLDVPLDRAPSAADSSIGQREDNRVAMVIDRNPISRATLSTLLAARCDQVMGANDVAEASAILETCRPVAILIDRASVANPADVRSLVDAADTATIALLCGQMDDEEQAAFVAAGVSRFVHRPIAKDRLAERVFGQAASAALVSAAA